MQYQNIWIRDLEDGIMTFVVTLDFILFKTVISTIYCLKNSMQIRREMEWYELQDYIYPIKGLHILFRVKDILHLFYFVYYYYFR